MLALQRQEEDNDRRRRRKWRELKSRQRATGDSANNPVEPSGASSVVSNAGLTLVDNSGNEVITND